MAKRLALNQHINVFSQTFKHFFFSLILFNDQTLFFLEFSLINKIKLHYGVNMSIYLKN